MSHTVFTECRMYETPNAVVFVPAVADSDEDISTLTFSKAPVARDATAFPSEHITVEAGAHAPPATDARQARTVAALLGVVPLGPGDWRLLVATRAEKTPCVPYAMRRVTETRLVPLQRAEDAAQNAAPAATRNYERLLARFLAVKSLYYAGDWDVTLCVQRRAALLGDGASHALPLWRRADERFFWNRPLLAPLCALGTPAADRWVLPAMVAFVQAVALPPRSRDAPAGERYSLALVSRRSHHRAGTRLFMRGIDEDGHVANSVETEQLVVLRGAADDAAADADGSSSASSSSSSEGETVRVASFVQSRGSIPAFWSQLPAVVYKPRPTLTAPRDASVDAAARHFRELAETYGTPVCCVNLVDHKGGELLLAQEYAAVVAALKQRDAATYDLRYTAFDFHRECKGGRTDRLGTLLADLAADIDREGWCECVLRDGHADAAAPIRVDATQRGVFRTNCVDNLDRTNVVQSMIARHVLARQLRADLLLHYSDGSDGSSDSSSSDSSSSGSNMAELERLYKNLWADNADAISTQYSGTGALKTDITRTGKRTLRGLVSDGTNSCMRYVKNNFYDGDLQDAYNYFLLLHSPVARAGAAAAASPAAAGPSRAATVFAAALALIVAAVLVALAMLRRGHALLAVAALLCALALALYVRTLVRRCGRELVNNPVLPLNGTAAESKKDI